VRIPRLDRPQDFAGLFLYDFGNRVSVGYTAEEIRVLKATPEHADGTAYRIHRVDSAGRFELQGVGNELLDRQTGMTFAYHDEADAQADYDRLRAAAEAAPLRHSAQLCLARLHEGDMRAAVVLSYPLHASDSLSAWLSQATFDGGVTAISRATSPLAVVDRCELPREPRFAPRSPDEVLAATQQSVQR
jgi:hypothetical protein